ncbi:MAG TPA: hypothetical protein VMZ28_03905, partial [Kofleriaceae bacterium]|nr:hypothetical protein [Kofleriaceae bacterium]
MLLEVEAARHGVLLEAGDRRGRGGERRQRCGAQRVCARQAERGGQRLAAGGGALVGDGEIDLDLLAQRLLLGQPQVGEVAGGVQPLRERGGGARGVGDARERGGRLGVGGGGVERGARGQGDADRPGDGAAAGVLGILGVVLPVVAARSGPSLRLAGDALTTAGALAPAVDIRAAAARGRGTEAGMTGAPAALRAARRAAAA